MRLFARIGHIQILSYCEGSDGAATVLSVASGKPRFARMLLKSCWPRTCFRRGRWDRLSLGGPFGERIVTENTILPVSTTTSWFPIMNTLGIPKHVFRRRKRLIGGLNPDTDDASRMFCVEKWRREDNNSRIGISHIDSAFVIHRDSGRSIQNRLVQTRFRRSGVRARYSF